MRWFVVFLLIANILLFIWVQQHSRSGAFNDTEALPEVGRLRLMSESGAPEASTPSKPEASPLVGVQDYSKPVVADADEDAMQPAGTDASAMVESATPQPDTRRDTEGEGLLIAPIVDKDESVTMTTAPPTLAESKPESSIEPEPASIPELTAEPVAPEPEPPSVEQPETAVVQAEPEPVTPAPDAVEPVCARIGPLAPEDAEKVLKSKPAYVSLFDDTTESTSVVTGYYVLIPPLPSRDDGRVMVKKLAAAGIKDTFLFRSGPLNNGISLGLFSRDVNAERHAKNVAAKGFDAQVRERTAVKDRRWLFLKNDAGGDWRDSIPLPEDVKIESRACPTE